MPSIILEPAIFEQYVELQNKDRKKVDKLNRLLMDIGRHPESGIGQVERMKGVGGNKYSRRISQKDRIVYTVQEDGSVVVEQIMGHYEDK